MRGSSRSRFGRSDETVHREKLAFLTGARTSGALARLPPKFHCLQAPTLARPPAAKFPRRLPLRMAPHTGFGEFHGAHR